MRYDTGSIDHKNALLTQDIFCSNHQGSYVGIYYKHIENHFIGCLCTSEFILLLIITVILTHTRRLDSAVAIADIYSTLKLAVDCNRLLNYAITFKQNF